MNAKQIGPVLERTVVFPNPPLGYRFATAGGFRSGNYPDLEKARAAAVKRAGGNASNVEVGDDPGIPPKFAKAAPATDH